MIKGVKRCCCACGAKAKLGFSDPDMSMLDGWFLIMRQNIDDSKENYWDFCSTKCMQEKIKEIE
jgi:hypothetical protein